MIQLATKPILKRLDISEQVFTNVVCDSKLPQRSYAADERWANDLDFETKSHSSQWNISNKQGLKYLRQIRANWKYF